MDLSAICFSKTMGNPFFLIQFLKLLESEDLLVYSEVSESWEWDGKKVKSETNVTGNILQVITERARHTKPGVREILRKASLLGFKPQSRRTTQTASLKQVPIETQRRKQCMRLVLPRKKVSSRQEGIRCVRGLTIE